MSSLCCILITTCLTYNRLLHINHHGRNGKHNIAQKLAVFWEVDGSTSFLERAPHIALPPFFFWTFF